MLPALTETSALTFGSPARSSEPQARTSARIVFIGRFYARQERRAMTRRPPLYGVRHDWSSDREDSRDSRQPLRSEPRARASGLGIAIELAVKELVRHHHRVDYVNHAVGLEYVGLR